MRIVRILPLCLALLTSCYSARHFTGDASRYDGLFFGAENEAARPMIVDDVWRMYAIWGIVGWNDEDEEFAGRRLSSLREGDRPARIYVRTQHSFMNGFAEFGVALLGGILQPLLFVPRTTEVRAWK